MNTQMNHAAPCDLSPGLSWEEDYRTRVNPELLTQLLHDAVPVARYAGWVVTRTGEGLAESVLPLREESTNQHGTHQAALLVLAADYTGGIALATLLRGVPVAGFHRQTTDNGAAIWLVRAHIDYRLPSTADLVISATISPDMAARVREGYAVGSQVMEEVEISFSAEGETIAVATFLYVLRQSRYLKPQAISDRHGVLFKHKTLATARLIAGVRSAAARSGITGPDPYSDDASGPQGRILTDRFTKILPLLPYMVAARTKHVDSTLVDRIENGVDQIVFLGSGLDFRCHRLASNGGLGPRRSLRVFELDLGHVLRERSKILKHFPPVDDIIRIPLEMNLELDALSDVLSRGGFDFTAPALFIFEGTSMYLTESINRQIFAALSPLMVHADSRVWLDVVSRAAIERAINMAEADAFLDGMEQLGEPFVFGMDDPHTFFVEAGLAVQENVTSGSCVASVRHPLLDHYRFCVLGKSTMHLHGDAINAFAPSPAATR